MVFELIIFSVEGNKCFLNNMLSNCRVRRVKYNIIFDCLIVFNDKLVKYILISMKMLMIYFGRK